MDWVATTSAEVLQEFTPAEKATLSHIQTDHEDANLPAILTSTRSEFLGAIAAAGHTLGAADLVPPSVKPHVIALTRWRFLIAFPKLNALQTVERRAAAQRAEEILDQIAKGERRIESPEDEASPFPGTWGSETKINMRTSTEED